MAAKKPKRGRPPKPGPASESCRKDRPFTWTKDREAAALLVAEDELTDAEIGAKVSISERQLFNWKAHPDFQARVKELARAAGEAMLRQAIAKRQRRVRALNDRWDALKQVVAERGTDPKMANVPGGKTGLLVHNVKGVGSGEAFQVVDLYEVDTGLLKELREHEKQAAQELGQWAEKHEHKGTVTIALTLEQALEADAELEMWQRERVSGGTDPAAQGSQKV